MTIKDLYEWAKQNNALDLEVVIQHRDSGGYYNHFDELETPTIDTFYQTEKYVVL